MLNRIKASPFLTWFATCTLPSDRPVTAGSDAYEHFKLWATREGHDPASPVAFGAALGLCCEKVTTRRGSDYFLRLRHQRPAGTQRGDLGVQDSDFAPLPEASSIELQAQAAVHLALAATAFVSFKHPDANTRAVMRDSVIEQLQRLTEAPPPSGATLHYSSLERHPMSRKMTRRKDGLGLGSVVTTRTAEALCFLAGVKSIEDDVSAAAQARFEEYRGLIRKQARDPNAARELSAWLAWRNQPLDDFEP